MLGRRTVTRASPGPSPTPARPRSRTLEPIASRRFARAVPDRTRSREPLLRGAVALVVNTGATSVLGLAFWILAAHRYPTAVIGDSAAVISLLLFCANVAELNLGSAVVRFVPTEGNRAKRFVVTCYAIAAACGIAIGAASLPLVSHLALVGELGSLGVVGLAWFCATVAVWCLFALEDAVLVAVRGARWVPLENGAYGVAKILVLLVVASLLPRLGIFVAWTLPMALTVVPVNLLIFRSLLPAHRRRAGRVEQVRVRQVGAFVGFEYLTSLATTSAQSLLPLVVLVRLGAQANGYFYVVWAAASAFDVALNNVGTVLVAEGARAPERLGQMVRTLAARACALLVPVVAAVLVGAPWLLRLLGAPFVPADVTLLRCLAAAVGARALICLWMSINRVHRTVGRILGVQSAISAAVLGGTLASLGLRPAISTVGLAYVAVQFAFALALVPSVWRVVRRPARAEDPRLALGG